LGGDLASITFKAIGNVEDSQLSLQLVVVCCLLLDELLEPFNLLVSLIEFLSVLGHLLVNSSGKPIGCGVDGGIEC
jgi:hypothetical protein